VDKRKIVPVPPDWSYIRLQTTGKYAQQPFTIVGRIRLQLRNDYKNFWCAALTDGAHLWIMESFGSIAIFPAVWIDYDKQVSALRAGQRIALKKDVKLTGEYVEKCEDLTYEGEIGTWKLFTPYFFFIQAANKENQVAIFTVNSKKDVEYLVGLKAQPEELSLQNIIQWDEWK
jgi:hypothetical protein